MKRKDFYFLWFAVLFAREGYTYRTTYRTTGFISCTIVFLSSEDESDDLCSLRADFLSVSESFAFVVGRGAAAAGC